MADASRPDQGRVVLTPEGTLLAEGSAEKFEAEIQTLFAKGHRHLVVDLRNVPHMDSSGIRAIVRGHTTAERLGGRFVLVAPSSRVAKLLAMTRLDTVLHIRDEL